MANIKSRSPSPELDHIFALSTYFRLQGTIIWALRLNPAISAAFLGQHSIRNRLAVGKEF